ncbi:hypothetical protein, partial [Amnibacterium sp.]|uniref:hypothetical protein n=1 Tax=Amnibacterium sp. TaxID=1872496 RepID=UPI003F7BF0EA
MRSTMARWVVALRIARRSALTSWGRSLLVITLIAVPITGLTAAAVLLPSTRSTLSERIQGTLGHSQALLTVEGSPGDHVEQGVEGGSDFTTTGDGRDTSRVDPRTVLPAGTRVLAIGAGAGVFTTPAGSVSLQVVTGPSWDPSLDGGPYALLSGRRPRAEDEVLLSPAALTRLGARVGGTVHLLQPEVRALRVVGTARDRSAPSIAETVFAATALFPPEDPSDNAFVYYVPDRPIGWTTVERLNAAGTTVFSRAVLADPPKLPASRDFTGSSGLSTGIAATVAIAVTFAVLEVALLAGAAFLVGARLQQRALATIASVGADRAVLRRIVTASGVVLGAVGGAVGVALGIGGALLVMRLTDDGSWTRYPGVHLIWPLLAGIVLFGVVVGWMAALLPARAASRFDVIRALRGARTPQRVGKRPLAGVVLLAAGIVLTLLGTGALVAALRLHGDQGTWAQLGALVLLGGGPVVAQLGVVLCSGLLLRAITRLLRRASLPTRLAARDTSRNLGRVVPAVASVMTTVFIAAFTMCIANTSSQQAAVQHSWNATLPGEAWSSVYWAGPGAPTEQRGEAWLATVRRALPVANAALIDSTSMGTDGAHPADRAADAMAVVRFPSPSTCTNPQRRDVHDLRCGPFSASGGSAVNAQPTISVGNASALRLLLGHAPSAGALAALDGGGAVALRSGLTSGGDAHLDWYTPKQLSDGAYESARPVRTTALATVTDLPVNPVQASLFVSTATASRLGLAVHPDRVLASFTRAPTSAELDAANAALGALGNVPYDNLIDVETGPQDLGSTIAWYVLLACLVIAVAAGATAIGLARVDGRPDDVTLASLGASPRIRRSIAAVQAIIVCGLGAVLGTLLGMLPALALGGATDSFPFSPPPVQLVLLALGIPAVIAVGSWLLVGTRRGDLTRRS